MNTQISWLLLISIIFWLSGLTFLILKTKSSIRQLFPEGDDKAVSHKFEEWSKALQDVNQREAVLYKNLKKLSVENLSNFQKVKLVRYNPYNDVGGDQSFSLAFLDGNNNGFILTSLHNRAGTRVYSKIVNSGKPEMQLSDEEHKLLDETLLA